MDKARNLFKRVISHRYQQDASLSVQVSTTQAASEKVANTVATFLNEGNAGSLFKRAIDGKYQQVVPESLQVLATQMTSEKVANMVATFLNFDS
jgi:hypothetical protein